MVAALVFFALIESESDCGDSAASTVLIFYGYDQGVFGNIVINEDFLNTIGYPSATMQGTMTSIYNIGCFIGSSIFQCYTHSAH